MALGEVVAGVAAAGLADAAAGGRGGVAAVGRL